jgi:plasmid stability protein
MSNLTVSVDENLIKQARVRAISQGTSLSAKVREFLLSYATGTDDVMKKRREEATGRLLGTLQLASLQAQSTANSGDTPDLHNNASHQNSPRRTLREELYAGDFRARDRESDSA